MKRKMVVLMLSAMMAVSLMAGCGSDKAVAAETEAATESITESESVMESESVAETESTAETEAERQLTEEECLAIDGGDAEYWKHYDAEGNPISRDEMETEPETVELETEPVTEGPDPFNMSDDELTEWLDGGDADSAFISDALQNLSTYRKMSDKLNAVEIYDSEDLTYDILINRNGKTIVEKCYGVVLDEEGNGTQLNPSVTGQDYIKYHDLPVGSVVLSVFVYNPETNAEDDIISRSDFVLDSLD